MAKPPNIDGDDRNPPNSKHFAYAVNMMLSLALAMVAPSLVPGTLRTEALANPLAVQTGRPQMAWKLIGTGRNLRQSAYQVRAASSRADLSREIANLWNTGKVRSDDSIGIRYSGKELASRADCWWQVRVWDGRDVVSPWSEPAHFRVGLLNATDWKAKWIEGDTRTLGPNLLQNAEWVVPAGSGASLPAGSFTLRRTLSAATSGKYPLVLTADNTFTLRLDGKVLHRTTDPEGWRSPVELTLDLSKGDHVLEVEVMNTTEGAAGLLTSLPAQGWENAKILGRNGIAPWGPIQISRVLKAPAQYFFKQFPIGKPVKRATLFGSALGIVDFEVNGQRVTEDLFTPGWSDYRKRVHYRAFDVTSQLSRGVNQLEAVVGQGWYAGYVAWGKQREHYGSSPKVLAQLEIEYTDGSRALIGTDQTWQVRNGMITDEHFLHGERAERVTQRNVKSVKLGTYSGKVEAFPGEPVRPYTRLKPTSIQKKSATRYLINFGQNLSGFTHVKVKGPSSGTGWVKIRHAERLDQSGNLYTMNLRSAKAEDVVDVNIARKGWSPRFTFHGFQFAEVELPSSAYAIDSIEAVAISSATAETGSLVTSDPKLNRLISNAWWTQKMNFVDVPTDCPQRDERLGWTGDAQVYVETATYFSDVHAFFKKWLETLDDSQRPDGQYPKVAPVIAGQDDGGPAWSDAGVICPTTIYQMTGDKTLLAKHYPNMKRFIEFTRSRNEDSVLPPKSFHAFGDWLSIRANTPSELIYAAYHCYSTQLVRDAAKVLGKKADYTNYDQLYRRLRGDFQREFVSQDGRIKGDTQTGYVMAIAFDLLTPSQKQLAAAHLVRDIENRGGKLSTGFVGTRDLLHALCKVGRQDVAFRLLHNEEFPSWLFPVRHGATSIWERWDGWTPENGFQDPGMNSFAHYAYGAVVGWMFKEMAGIQPLEAGFRRIRIAPRVDPKLTWQKCAYDSVRGRIRSEWRRSGKAIRFTFEVPPNTRAVIELPGKPPREVGSGVWTFS